MRRDSSILNVQDNEVIAARKQYLTDWETDAKIWLRQCPVCTLERGLGKKKMESWFVIIRRTLRGMTIRCRRCDLQVSITYRNLRKAIKGLGDWARVDSGPEAVDDSSMLVDMASRDVIEHRGRVKVTAQTI